MCVLDLVASDYDHVLSPLCSFVQVSAVLVLSYLSVNIWMPSGVAFNLLWAEAAENNGAIRTIPFLSS